MKGKNYHDHKRMGLCVRCCDKAEPGKIYCLTHAEAERDRQRKKHAKRKEAGQCRYCTRQPLPGRALCEKHLETERIRSKTRGKHARPKAKTTVEKVTMLSESDAVKAILALRAK